MTKGRYSAPPEHLVEIRMGSVTKKRNGFADFFQNKLLRKSSPRNLSISKDNSILERLDRLSHVGLQVRMAHTYMPLESYSRMCYATWNFASTEDVPQLIVG